MTQIRHNAAGNTETQQNQGLAHLLAQSAPGKAATGVLTGLGVTQTATASASVLVGAGAAAVQAATLDGASVLVNDTQITLDVLTANPVGGLPRNDIVVFDAATLSAGAGAVRVIVGTPNASPTDPTVPTSAIALARLRHAASATTVPTAKIDDLRVKTAVAGAADENFVVRGVPMAGASTTKAGKRAHWGVATVTPGGTGYATITHGAGFTPTVVTASTEEAVFVGVHDFAFTSTQFTVRLLERDGSAYSGSTDVYYFCGE